MVAKIIYSKKTENFGAVRYNTNKVDQKKGELVKVVNFDALMGLENIRPEDYVNYLEALSSKSKRIKQKQFHAVISCKGRSHSKEELTAIAEKWVEGMGYGKQPYLLVFHKDTLHNHLHIVSTRVGQNGKKISDSYEQIKANRLINKIVAMDEPQSIEKDIKIALEYKFSTHPQFMMLLEAKGYSLIKKGSFYVLYKDGKELTYISLGQVDLKISQYQKDEARIKQLHAIFEKYRRRGGTTVYETQDSKKGLIYTSELAQYLRVKLGVELLFHGKDGKPPYGYTVIDHQNKIAFKGGEIMDIKILLEPIGLENQEDNSPDLGAEQINDLSTNQIVTETIPSFHTSTGEPFSENDFESGQFNLFDHVAIDISDDIDDEQINGRNRRRKRKARTNTR